MKKIASTAIALVIAAVLAPAAAHASEDLHPDAEYALEAVPGGVAVSDTTVVWPALGMILEAEPGVARSVGSCPTGAHCAFAGTGLTGTRLTFTVCTTSSTAALQSVKSIANARSSGTVRARNAAGGVLGTVGPGGATDVSVGTTNLRCSL